jgi:hypothetical protein
LDLANQTGLVYLEVYAIKSTKETKERKITYSIGRRWPAMHGSTSMNSIN